MNPLLLNTTDIEGGAARAAYRLHTGLKLLGVDSKMLVGLKYSDDISVIAPTTKLGKGMAIVSTTLDALPLEFYRKRERTIFSPACLPEHTAKKIELINPDIIHLHWICRGFLRIETLRKFQKPIVWTLHDMWAFTGGCHYDNSCVRYNDTCGSCPQLNSKRQNDLSCRVWRRKKKAWQGLDITIVTPSQCLAECARSSSLFQRCRIEVIPNGLNMQCFNPIDKKMARDILSLPQDKILIFFGAMESTTDKRKGFQFLAPALQVLANSGWHNKVELIVFGSSKPDDPPDFGLKVNYLGQFKDEISLAILYAAADVFVLPSIQDNLPNTIMESLACGTPVVAFDVGGIPEMVEHQVNGYLAKAMDTDDLAHGIQWVLEDPERSFRLGKAAREKAVREYPLEVQARRYLDLYEEILDKQKRQVEMSEEPE